MTFQWAFVDMAFFPQRIAMKFQRAQTFTIKKWAEVLGFRAIGQIPFQDPQLEFTPNLHQALQFLGE